MLKGVFSYFDTLLFPHHCPFCERILDKREGSTCGECIQSLPFVVAPICEKCGKPLACEGSLCEDCMQRTHFFEQGKGVFRYENDVAESILRFKYHHQRRYASIYSEWIVRCLGEWIKQKGIDLIIPVPIHHSRLRERGYNQAAMIAELVAKNLKIEYSSNSVVRSKKTLPQKKLSVFERMENMQNAFCVNTYKVRNKKVLIIDDIYTTGTTVDAISLGLKKAGAIECYFAVVSLGGD